MSNNKPVIIAFILVLVAIAGLIGYFATNDEPEPVSEQVELPPAPEPEPEPPPVVQAPPPPPEPEPVPVEPEEPDFVLPTIDASDQLIRDGVVTLTRNEEINSWVQPNQLVRKFVAFTDNVARGQIAREPVSMFAPEGPFQAKQLSEDTWELDPVSYERYNHFTDVAVSVDARRAAEFYHLVKPLVQEAFTELGYGEAEDGEFDDLVFEAIGRLLETPVIEGPILLERPKVMYQYKDPTLENLSAAQKQLLRMGPDNARRLKAKLSEIATELRAVLDR